MIKNENDPRAIRTRNSLVEAYIRLAGMMPRDQISVTAVTREAGMNRRTYYGHYNEISHLLDDVEQYLAAITVQSVLNISGGGTATSDLR